MSYALGIVIVLAALLAIFLIFRKMGDSQRFQEFKAQERLKRKEAQKEKQAEKKEEKKESKERKEELKMLKEIAKISAKSGDAASKTVIELKGPNTPETKIVEDLKDLDVFKDT